MSDKYDEAVVQSLREMDRQRIEKSAGKVDDVFNMLNEKIESLKQSMEENLVFFDKVLAQRDALKVAALSSLDLMIFKGWAVSTDPKLREQVERLSAALALVKG